MNKFAETFWTPYEEEQYNKRIGQKFTVLGEKPKDTYDYEEVGTVYMIQFEDGVKAEALPEEVESHWQIANGRNEFPNGYYVK